MQRIPYIHNPILNAINKNRMAVYINNCRIISLNGISQRS